MQKKLIAMAVAGLVAAPAFAQSSVTVYGIIDATVAYGKAGDSKFTGIYRGGAFNGTRIGFKGTEDLGNGLKAVFQLEQGFWLDDGEGYSSKQFHRTAYAGLQGGFGTVSIGRQYASGYLTFKYDAFGGGDFDARTVLNDQLKIQVTSAQRYDNSVVWQSDSMGGLKARVTYGFGSDETSDDRSDDDKVAVGLDYAAGPLQVGYVYVNEGNVNDGGTKDRKEHFIGASYDLGTVAIKGTVQRAEVSSSNDVNLYSIGATVKVGGAGLVYAQFAMRTEDADERDAKALSLAYRHSMSKRTSVYAAVNRTNNDANSSDGVVVGAAGEDSTSMGVGINHKF